MGDTSKDLLHLERNNSSSSSLESKLLVCKSDSLSQNKRPLPAEKPVMAPVPPSQFLGKVRDFLGVMSEANARLQLDAKDHNIEVLSENESQYIEMDLMLGVADLHTPEAVAAAESAVAGYQPVIPLAASDSETESEDSSDDEDEDEVEDGVNDNGDNCHDSNDKTCSPAKSELSKSRDDKSSRGLPLKKRPKIIEVSQDFLRSKMEGSKD